MLNATLYAFPKRVNSTKMPSYDMHTAEITVSLKEGSSILTPIFLLNLAGSSTVLNSNYMMLTQWVKFYFINEWINVAGTLWELHCTEDVLATYKPEIGAQTHYILRSASAYNGYIADSAYITDASPDITISKFLNPFLYGVSGNPPHAVGTYVLGVISSSSSSQGSVAYYMLDETSMNSFKAWLTSDPAAYFPTGDPWEVDLSEDTLKFLFNPYQYIVSIEWFPRAVYNLVLSGVDTLTPIKFGWWDCPVQAYLIGPSDTCKRVLTFGPVSISAHRQSATRGAYLDHAPFVSYHFSIPPFGEIDANMDNLSAKVIEAEQDDIYLNIVFDLVIGNEYIVSSLTSGDIHNDLHIINAETKISVPVTVASVLTNSTAAELSNSRMIANNASLFLNDATSVAGAMKTGNVLDGINALGNIGIDVLNAGINMKSAAYDGFALRSPSVQIFGNNGGRITFDREWYVIRTEANLVSEYNTEIGRPLYEPKVINTLSGFIQCSGASSTISKATLQESNLVNEFLNAGFFFE